MLALNENYRKQVSKKLSTACPSYAREAKHRMLQPLNSAHDAVPDSPAMQLKKFPLTFNGDSIFDDSQDVFATLERYLAFDA